MGLLSESGVHSELSHLLYLIRFFRTNGVKEIYIHAFLDGRDSPPKSAEIFLKKLMEEVRKLKPLFSYLRYAADFMPWTGIQDGIGQTGLSICLRD
jgi:phosphoglycerate mutase (EC 5.4.2.1)